MYHTYFVIKMYEVIFQNIIYFIKIFLYVSIYHICVCVFSLEKIKKHQNIFTKVRIYYTDLCGPLYTFYFLNTEANKFVVDDSFILFVSRLFRLFLRSISSTSSSPL